MENQVRVEYNDKNGRFFIASGAIIDAEMTFYFSELKHIVIKHTEVSPQNAGKGLGKMLVAKAVEFARENGLKITPLCHYAKSVFDKTPSYSDVL